MDTKKQSSLTKMAEVLERKGINVVGTAEQFYGSSSRFDEDCWKTDNGLWISGEDTPEMFDYWTCDHDRYEFGVRNDIRDLAEKHGYWFEWNDPGTIMCWKYRETELVG